MRWLLILASFLVVALGQPAWVPWLAPVAAICGYALLWMARPKFWLATLWFTGVMLLQLSWMAVDEYHGVYIWFSWSILSLICGLQFGLMTKLSKWVVPFAWVVMEYLRLYILAGFTWNPVGLSLTAYAPSRAFVALFGIYGLSFIVMATNVLIYRRKWVFAALVAAAPYLYGVVHMMAAPAGEAPTLAVLLVQPGISPGQRQAVPHSRQEVLPPLEQWRIIAGQLAEHEGAEIDLIVFPEGMAPYQGNALLFEEEVAQGMLLGALGNAQFPSATGWLGAWGSVNSAYLCQALADTFECDVVAGLDWQSEQGNSYNAALHFAPGNEGPVGRYGKRVLLPFAEYLPGEWLRPLAAKYGIGGFYTHGEGAERFDAKVPIAPTICYEETFGRVVRESGALEVELLANITNDGWYPRSKLPEQHFYLGRLRAVENGLPLVRACSTGVTAAIDAQGRTLAALPKIESAGTLLVDVPLTKQRTLYSLLGDGPILGMSLFAIALYLKARTRG